MIEFFKVFVIRVQPWPEEFMQTMHGLETNPIVYHTM